MFRRHGGEDEAPPPEPHRPLGPPTRITPWTGCPKCASTAVVTAENGVGFKWKIGYRDATGFASGDKPYWTWLCLDCGYFENYLTDREKLEAIRADPAHDGWRSPESPS